MSLEPMGVVLSKIAARRPDQTCLIYSGEAVSWRTLDERSNQCARWLEAQGVKQDDIVTLALPNCIGFHELVFGLWKLGATPHIAAHNLGPREMQDLLALACPRLAIGRGPILGAGLGFVPEPDVSLHSFDPLSPKTAKYWRALSSGGSTGRPKLIVDSMPSVFDAKTLRSGPFPHDACILNPGPLHHSVPFFSIHVGLLQGNCIIGMERFDAEEALRLIEQYRVRCVAMTPTMLHRIWRLGDLRRANFDLSSLTSLMQVGAPTPIWLKENFIQWLGAEKIFEIYGSTESIGETMISGTEWITKKGSVGKPVPGVQLKIISEAGVACAPGEIGEIYTIPKGGPGSRYHYLGAEPKRIDGGWESLGDLGWLDEDGYLFIADRRTDLILSGGANIYPAEIESALLEHPDIASALVVGRADDDLGEQVHAIIQMSDEISSLSKDDLDAFLAPRLVRYKRPHTYEFTDENLRDDAGKARRAYWRDRTN